MKSRTVDAGPSSRYAFGHESLSRELTRHVEAAVGAGDVTFIVTKSPGLTPETATPK